MPNERNRVRKGDSPKRIHRKRGRVCRCITANTRAICVADTIVRVNRCTPVIVAALIDYWLRTNDHRNNPAQACDVIRCKNLALNIRDCLSLSFGGDTKSRWSLLSGVYARGSKRSHQSALEMCNLWTPHSNIEKDNSLNHSCVSPSMGCFEYT